MSSDVSISVITAVMTSWNSVGGMSPFFAHPPISFATQRTYAHHLREQAGGEGDPGVGGGVGGDPGVGGVAGGDPGGRRHPNCAAVFSSLQDTAKMQREMADRLQANKNIRCIRRSTSIYFLLSFFFYFVYS